VEQIKHLIVYELEQAKKGIREVPQEQNYKFSFGDLKSVANEPLKKPQAQPA